ncbi:lytic transglycosylase domain-containing protein [Bizionia myxarmorum]|uniref:Lytic transglycosylase domain-containing protein n=1 Tax=Bizionia myxarmorum TaxID=291186 RepID=A0A5D0RFR6_9FLAO|nr:lytic transglycosylase domain-containing protein [Bizionia myxarmorum]TYB79645.1 lytic transglycosylase domain-containing protein [Bizionia myxarmorum]
MRKSIVNYIVLVLIIGVLVFSSFKSNKTIKANDYFVDDIAINTVEPIETSFDHILPLEKIYKPFSPTLGKSFVGFKEALGFKESRGDYFIVNTYGYLGKYQFGKETLKLIGIHNPVHFLKNPELQEKAFLANAERNKWILRKDIKRFDGKTINGVRITESGILAAAHLAGPGNVKKYLRSLGADGFTDAYGTSIQYYIKKFSGYDTSKVQPNQKAKVTLTA